MLEEIYELLEPMRLYVVVTIGVFFILALRWRRWLEADYHWRLIGLALVMNLAATLIGTWRAMAAGLAGGGQVPIYLASAVVAVIALLSQRRRSFPTKVTTKVDADPGNVGKR